MLETLAVLLVLAVLVASIPFFMKWLAVENILFTTVKEGTSKAIMRGKSFDRFLMAFDGYHLNDASKPWYRADHPEWEVLYHGRKNGDPGEKDNQYDDRSWLLKHLGLYWVGWPWANSVYVSAFEWNETYTDKEGKEKILPRAEATDFIFIADFTYAILTEEAETNDRLPTNELTLITVAIRNPYRALFSGEDWMRRISAAINRHVRNFVGEKDFQGLISVPKDELALFSGSIIALSERLPDDKDGKLPHGLLGKYGVEIRTADLQTIELSGDAKKEHQEATTMAYAAEQKAAAMRLEGQAKADVIKMIGDQEAAALEARLVVIKEHGEAGIMLAGYDAIQESSKNPAGQIIWANNPLGALAGLLKGGKES